jgi:hypothetical protein
VLGIEVLRWEIDDRPAERGRYTDQIKTNVSIFDDARLNDNKRYGIYQINLGLLYYFDISQITNAVCVGQKDVESIVGKAAMMYSRPHGMIGWAGDYRYSFASDKGEKIVRFSYVSRQGQACLYSLGVRLQPLSKP